MSIITKVLRYSHPRAVFWGFGKIMAWLRPGLLKEKQAIPWPINPILIRIVVEVEQTRTESIGHGDIFPRPVLRD